MKKELIKTLIALWHLCAGLLLLMMLHDLISKVFSIRPYWFAW